MSIQEAKILLWAALANLETHQPSCINEDHPSPGKPTKFTVKTADKKPFCIREERYGRHLVL